MAPSKRFRAALTLAARYDQEPVLGLPASAMVLTNTERREAHCPKKWWFSRGLQLERPSSDAMRFGSAFDGAMESILRFYAENEHRTYTQDGLNVCPGCNGGGCSGCSGSGLGAYAQQREILWAESLADQLPEQDIDSMSARLLRALEGWLHMYDDSMASEYRVLSAQLQLAAPVTNQEGRQYKSRVPVVETEEGWRLATAYDAPSDVRLVLLPWFQLCKLDGLVQERRSGKLRVWETKTSSSPDRFSRDLTLDTQLPGYLRSLWYVTQELGAFEGAQPSGWVWDVTSSLSQEDPKVLKSGKLSTATNQRVPSWRWERHSMAAMLRLGSDRGEPRLSELLRIKDAVQQQRILAAEAAADFGRGKAGKSSRQLRDQLTLKLKSVDEEIASIEYDRKIADMASLARTTVDTSLYVRQWGDHTPEMLSEYEAELLSDAKMMSSWLRSLPGTADIEVSRFKVAQTWPRRPICRGPAGYCSYSGICQQYSEHLRLEYNMRQSLRWLHSDAAALHKTRNER